MDYMDFEDDIRVEKEDAYWRALEAFWYQVRKIEKDWEQLNWYEVDNLKMEYEAEKERTLFPMRFYGVDL